MNFKPAVHAARSPQAALTTALLALVVTFGGCSSLDARPAPGPRAPAIFGHWEFDAARSDDFDAKLNQLMKERQQRMRARHGMGARRGEGGSLDSRDFDRLELPQEGSDRFRTRTSDDLRPARTLSIASEAEGDAIIVKQDAETVGRRFQPGQTVSRIDEGGAAQINCGWKLQAFEVHARYVHSATRDWHYEIESGSGMLLLRFDVNDPEIGRLAMVSRYRRVTP